MKHFILSLIMLCLAIAGMAPSSSAQESGFSLIVVGDTQPQTDAQLLRLEQEIMPEIGSIVDEYRATCNLPTYVLITGDVVWDNMAFLPRVQELFESLDAELITVIGNHDHDRNVKHNERLQEQAYEDVFGSRYKTFTLGNTRFILLDNIRYRAYERYSIGIDHEQRKWLRHMAKNVAKNERIAVCMHATAYDYRNDKIESYARWIMRLFEGCDIHFITGHRHRHATKQLSENAIEHNVAQVNGNLWFAPLCTDGTPPGVLCIEERNGVWQWQFRTFDRTQQQVRIWHEGEVKDNEEYIVVKVIGWDDKHRVEWREDDKNMGAMEQITILDPDYIYYVEHEASHNETIMARLRRSTAPHSHYFRCKRSDKNSDITIVLTDRFGRSSEHKVSK